ncbi:hypothetical protein GMES_2339 [Paraglaciecola mesophila KMM 241]|uniref:Uncharacterized protein n=1 Tax=Paraglaciecola mesophila KMM 241 TaxID=1128912 RepID=K6ZMN8_9ALTE|nr:hypothetical protein GMES_2339 [Paraglaciecola mesophila KMM 241]
MKFKPALMLCQTSLSLGKGLITNAIFYYWGRFGASTASFFAVN